MKMLRLLLFIALPFVQAGCSSSKVCLTLEDELKDKLEDYEEKRKERLECQTSMEDNLAYDRVLHALGLAKGFCRSFIELCSASSEKRKSCIDSVAFFMNKLIQEPYASMSKSDQWNFFVKRCQFESKPPKVKSFDEISKPILYIDGDGVGALDGSAAGAAADAAEAAEAADAAEAAGRAAARARALVWQKELFTWLQNHLYSKLDDGTIVPAAKHPENVLTNVVDFFDGRFGDYTSWPDSLDSLFFPIDVPLGISTLTKMTTEFRTDDQILSLGKVLKKYKRGHSLYFDSPDYLTFSPTDPYSAMPQLRQEAIPMKHIHRIHIKIRDERTLKSLVSHLKFFTYGYTLLPGGGDNLRPGSDLYDNILPNAHIWKMIVPDYVFMTQTGNFANKWRIVLDSLFWKKYVNIELNNERSPDENYQTIRTLRANPVFSLNIWNIFKFTMNRYIDYQIQIKADARLAEKFDKLGTRYLYIVDDRSETFETPGDHLHYMSAYFSTDDLGQRNRLMLDQFTSGMCRNNKNLVIGVRYSQSMNIIYRLIIQNQHFHICQANSVSFVMTNCEMMDESCTNKYDYKETAI